MAFFLDLFTPETWQAFREAGASVTGFRPRQRQSAIERISSGDVFLCYLTRLSRWCGVTTRRVSGHTTMTLRYLETQTRSLCALG